jgi:hypothetical protein
MDQITKLYYNKYINLQEKYYQLMEDGIDRLAAMSEQEFEDFVRANPGSEELAKKKRAEGKARKTNEPKSKNQSAKPAPETSSTPTEEEIARNKAREQYAKEWAQKQKEAEAKNPKPGAAKPKAERTPKPAQTSVKPSIAQKTTNLAKGFGKGLAGFGVGMGGYFLGKGASDIALGAAGVENETAKEIAGEAVGGAAGGVAATGVGSLMAGAGLPTAAAIGGAALKGGLVGLAAYGGLKAGQAIGQAVGDIEIDEKGTQVSDVAGKTIYDIYGKMTGKGTSSEQLNTAKTGVVGGDKQKIAQNIADEAEEEFQKKAEMEKRKAAIRARRAMEK